MQTRSISLGPGAEIACDESGFSGRNLVRSDTLVFAHASVHLSTASAISLIAEVRDRTRSPGIEYKSNRLLREKDRSQLEWFLGPRGPLDGNAHVHLTDKAFFVVRGAVELLVGDTGDADEPAVTLYREGPAVFGHQRWRLFLDAANDLVNGGKVDKRSTLIDAFFGVLDDLDAAAAGGGPVGRIVRALCRSGALDDPVRAELLLDPKAMAALDPFVPAIVRAVEHWSAELGPVVIVHDEQSALSRTRIAQLRQLLGRPGRTHPMSGLRGADSRTDPRVQVADLLAGLARRIASDALAGRADPALAALLRRYVDEQSVWADDRSWSVLAPHATQPDHQL